MKKIGEMLIENKLLSKSDLEKALEKQRTMKVHKPIGQILVESNIITIDVLLKYLDIQLSNHS